MYCIITQYLSSLKLASKGILYVLFPIPFSPITELYCPPICPTYVNKKSRKDMVERKMGKGKRRGNHKRKRPCRIWDKKLPTQHHNYQKKICYADVSFCSKIPETDLTNNEAILTILVTSALQEEDINVIKRNS